MIASFTDTLPPEVVDGQPPAYPCRNLANRLPLPRRTSSVRSTASSRTLMFSRWLSSESAVNASSASYPCRAIRTPLAWSMTDRDERAWRRFVTMSRSERVVSMRWNTCPTANAASSASSMSIPPNASAFVE